MVGNRDKQGGAVLTADQHILLADKLYQARTRCEALTPLSDHYPQMETADSYAIQARLVARYSSFATGYKLGFTSAAMREQMGVNEPNFGVLLAETLAVGEINHRQFIHPLIEPEIAVVTRSDLAGKNVTLDEVVAAVASLHAAMEIVDSRFQDYRFKSVDNIADNSSAAGYCLGLAVDPVKISGPELLTCRLFRNDEVVAEGVGADAMGGPYQALLWLVTKLAEQGQSLPAGSVVLTGGLSRAQQSAPGDHFRAEFSGLLGTADLRLTDG